ncbi:Metalloprotease TIKI [Trichostrongylus colubriformis]|uniref:Metalloprotease TIKI homolog n=1 Tax=Trichostrongylus colubriformis TaxID=6319 RepID=A0AAN8FXJ1_TRICO
MFTVSDRVREAFSYSDTVLLEIDLRNEETVKRLIKCRNLKRKQTTASYLNPKLRQRIKDFMEKFRRTLLNCHQKQEEQRPESYKIAEDLYESIAGSWDRKRPEWLLFALYQLCENFLNRPTTPMLDVFLANKAYEEDKQIHAIETAHEQCNPVASLSQEEIIFAINYTVHYLEYLHHTKKLFQTNNQRSLSALVKDYRCGTLDDRYFEINEYSINGFYMDEGEKLRAEKIQRHLREDIIAKRNERMAYRLHRLLSKNPQITIFSAIGTGHFFGNGSILHHLHNIGYIINSVKEDDVLDPPRNYGKAKTFNSLWLRDHPFVSNVSIEIIEINSSSIHSTNFFLFLAVFYYAVGILPFADSS